MILFGLVVDTDGPVLLESPVVLTLVGDDNKASVCADVGRLTDFLLSEAFMTGGRINNTNTKQPATMIDFLDIMKPFWLISATGNVQGIASLLYCLNNTPLALIKNRKLLLLTISRQPDIVVLI